MALGLMSAEHFSLRAFGRLSHPQHTEAQRSSTRNTNKPAQSQLVLSAYVHVMATVADLLVAVAPYSHVVQQLILASLLKVSSSPAVLHIALDESPEIGCGPEVSNRSL